MEDKVQCQACGYDAYKTFGIMLGEVEVSEVYYCMACDYYTSKIHKEKIQTVMNSSL